MPKTATAKPRLRSRKYAPKASNVKPSDSLDGLREIRATEVSKYGTVKATSTAYNGHRSRGFKFLADLVSKRRAIERVQGLNEDGICTSTLEHAFDEEGPPNRYSALVLEMFLVQKCFNEGCGKDTADGIHGAFAAMWDQMHGGKYSKEYQIDEATGEIVGCPARAANVKAVVHSIKVRDKSKGASALRNHADAMTVQDLQKIMQWSEEQCPPQYIEGDSWRSDCESNVPELVHRLQHGFMQAFLPSGHLLWTRCFELLDMKVGDIEFNCTGPSPYNVPFFKVELLNRKGWQNEQGYEGPREPHIYSIYPQTIPALDMYTHLLRWKSFIESILGRPLNNDEYLFPHIGVNGVIRMDRKMSYDNVLKLLTSFCMQSGVNKRYTTHSLRRGGAQYRFLYAESDQLWDLNRIRWWGGWAPGEHCDTLIKYLVDSLQSLENDHGDALNPLGRNSGIKYFEKDNTKPPTKEEFRLATAATDLKINACVDAVRALGTAHVFDIDKIPTTRRLPTAESAIPQLEVEASSINNDDDNSCSQTIAPSSQASYPQALRSLPRANVSIMPLGRQWGAWRRAIKQWTEIDPATGVSLRDWPFEWYTGNMRTTTGSLRGQRQIVYEEYKRLGCNDVQFLGAYPEADKSLKQLLIAIRQNTRQRRTSKNGTPAARSCSERESTESSSG